MELRENQIEPVKKGVEFFKKTNPPSLMVCPTAFGKSLVISKIANDIGDKMLVLQPSKELLEQNLEKLRAFGGDASIYSASLKTKEIGHITYATIGSIKNIGHEFKGYKLIIDEVDRYPRGGSGMLRKFIKSAGIKHILGLTATPFKLKTLGGAFENYSILRMLTARAKEGTLFKEIIHVCQIQEMLDNNYWSPIIYDEYEFNKENLIFNSTKAEYTDSSVRKVYEEQNIEEKIIKCIEETDRKSILVFVPSVAEAISLASKIPGAEAVYGDMDGKERKRVLSGFKNLSIRVVVNVNVLSVGFDHPELDMIVCGRATASLSWWYQAVGRGTRIHPNKENLLVADFAGNTNRFGKIECLYYKQEGIAWKLYGENGKLLTGIPIDTIGQHTEDTERVRLENIEIQRLNTVQIQNEGIIPFGKFKGKKVSETPKWWRDWMLQNFKFDKMTEFIREHINELT